MFSGRRIELPDGLAQAQVGTDSLTQVDDPKLVDQPERTDRVATELTRSRPWEGKRSGGEYADSGDKA